MSHAMRDAMGENSLKRATRVKGGSLMTCYSGTVMDAFVDPDVNDVPFIDELLGTGRVS